MKWNSQVSTEMDLPQAIAEVAARIRDAFNGDRPDLLTVFASGYPYSLAQQLPKLLAAELPSQNLLGCTAGGVIGGGLEVEHRPALSLTAALLPGISVSSFHLRSEAIPDAHADAETWARCLQIPAEETSHLLLLSDPFSFEIDRFVSGLDQHFPASVKIGGLASGATQRGMNLLFVGPETYDSGLVGVALRGPLEIDTLVAQGCRPIGSPMFITRCRQNLLQELDGKPPAAVLQELYQHLDSRDQGLFRQSLFLGLVMKESQKEYHQGDFLIRNILGIDESRESLVVAAPLREGQVVQFHLRDANTSSEDLNAMLIRYKTEHLRDPSPAGALIFSCLGRGAYLYGEANHDTKTFQRFLGDTPLGGFFCNGEIGPVHGRTYLHGYTSSFGLFRQK